MFSLTILRNLFSSTHVWMLILFSLAGNNSFVVADPKLKLLEDSCFCSNGRIICHEEGLTVEFRVSRVIAADVMDVPAGYKEINQ